MSSCKCSKCKSEKPKYEDKVRDRASRAKKDGAKGKKAGVRHTRDERFETKFTKRYGKDGKECSFDFSWTGSHSESFSLDLSADSKEFKPKKDKKKRR